MKKLIRVVVAMVVVTLGLCIACTRAEINWEDISRGNTDFRVVLVNPDDPRVIYAGSGKAVFRTEDGGSSWKSVLIIKGQNTAVNSLLFDPLNKGWIFAGTGSGLFYSKNSGATWSRICRGEVMAMAILPAQIYLGTNAGFFVSQDKGRTWSKVGGKIGNSHILTIAGNFGDPKELYVASTEGVFTTKNGGISWERIFVTCPAEEGREVEEESEDKDEDEGFSDIRHIAIDPNNANRTYLATAKGVYRSNDKGTTWEFMNNYGLLSRNVNFILVSSQFEIYAATKSGVFKYTKDRWQELSLDLAADKVRFLAADNQGNLYAVSQEGLFKSQRTSFNGKENQSLQTYCENEPKIREIQQAAIEYAEVGNEKIEQWRALAAKKAWLPQVSVGLDRNTTDLWHWEGGSTTKTDDDTLRKGNDSVDWDLRLTWDFSELIWNQDQTSIDVRSKLMVQLRDDILDQVTKLYFERLRVKMELANLAIEDKKKRSDKELKFAELTASLDALTGGYFSRR